MPAILALCAAAAFGVADFLGGFATRRAPVIPVTVVSNTGGAVVAVVLWFAVGGEWTSRSVLLGAVGGLAGLVGLVMLYDALATGPFQVASPVSAVTGAAVPVVAGIAFGDRPEILAIIGLVLTPPAIWLLASGSSAESETSDGRASGRLVAQSFLAGAGFGTFFVFLDQTPDGAGAVPLIAARCSSLTALAVISAVKGTRLPSKDALPMALGAGSVDMAANGFFLWATRDGDLSVVGALTSLYPAGTVVWRGSFWASGCSRSNGQVSPWASALPFFSRSRSRPATWMQIARSIPRSGNPRGRLAELAEVANGAAVGACCHGCIRKQSLRDGPGAGPSLSMRRAPRASSAARR